MPFLILFIIFLSGCGQNSNPIPKISKSLKANQEISQEIVLKNQFLVSKALDFMEDEKNYLADGRTPTQCGSIGYKYRIHKRDKKLLMSLSILFDGPEHLVDRAKLCMNDVSTFFERYNIKFSTVYRDSHNDHRVKLVEGSGRSNSKKWYAEDFSEECSVAIHEVAHLLGFPDEYYEKGTCRTEEYKASEENPYSLMGARGENLENFHFMPRHIFALLEQALPSQLALEFNEDMKSNDFGSCFFIDARTRKLLSGLSFKIGERIILDEVERSEYQTTSPRFKGLFETELEFGGKRRRAHLRCDIRGAVSNFFDWNSIFESKNVSSMIAPFDFEDHLENASLLYLRK